MNKIQMEVTRGDLLEAVGNDGLQYMLHGCNCFHAMYGGIAAHIAKRFPEAEKADEDTPYADPSKLGRFSTAMVTDHPDKEHNFEIINLYTQYESGADFIPSTFKWAMRNLNKEYTGAVIGIPMIGCGIGGGDWGVVMPQMLEYAPDIQWELYLL
jgi:O-acetyl-ADP-ribose deacetylase (regulator of RNase III)